MVLHIYNIYTQHIHENLHKWNAGQFENSGCYGGAAINNNSLDFGILDWMGSNNAYFNGTIDEVLIFNRALSPEEINASYNAGSLPIISQLH